MLVKLDPTLDIGAIIDSWHEYDQYDDLGDTGQAEEDAIADILKAIDGQVMTLMELMQACRNATDLMVVSFLPYTCGYRDAHGVVQPKYPSLVFVLDAIATDLSIVEMDDHYFITTESVL